MADGFLITTKDYGRKSNPYGSALLVCEHNDGFFELTIPTESISSIFGERETFDYNVLTELAKGLVEGKLEMQPATQEFFLTKENLNRLDELKDKVYKYMVVGGNGVGYTYNAKISYRFADIENGDILKGEMTITPSSFDSVLMDCRPFIRQTLMLAGTIPAKVTLSSEHNEETLICKIENGDSTAKVVAKIIGDGSNMYEEPTWDSASGKLTLKASGTIKAPAYAMAYITLSDTATHDGGNTLKYAPYTLIVDLDYVGAAD